MFKFSKNSIKILAQGIKKSIERRWYFVSSIRTHLQWRGARRIGECKSKSWCGNNKSFSLFSFSSFKSKFLNLLTSSFKMLEQVGLWVPGDWSEKRIWRKDEPGFSILTSFFLRFRISYFLNERKSTSMRLLSNCDVGNYSLVAFNPILKVVTLTQWKTGTFAKYIGCSCGVAIIDFPYLLQYIYLPLK